MAKAKIKTKGALHGYLEDSRDLFTSLLLVLPLFVIYQIGILATGGVRNGVDFVTDFFWLVTGGNTTIYILINLGVLVALVAGLVVMRNRGTFRARIVPILLAESTLYAMFLGTVVILMMQSLGMGALLASGMKSYGLLDKFILSIGAGLYEEAVFRLFLLSGIFWVGIKALKLPTWASAVIAVVISSVIFSAVHYIGPLGDPFQLGSFLFRFFAGAVLAVIFYLRGFAVAVYTHAIYDIIVLIFR